MKPGSRSEARVAFALTRLDRSATLLAALGLAAALAWLQFSQRTLVTGDSYFHVRAAQQLAEHGIRKQFPQAVYSTWAERYSDKDLLFHVLLLPFCADEREMVRGAKLAVVALDLAILLVLAQLMHRLGARAGWLWLLLLGSAHWWLWLHLAQARPHLLGVWLLILEIGLLLRERRVPLALVTGAHVWSHTSFLLVPGLPLCRAIARRLNGEAAAWGDFVAVGAGLALASLVHPYFPNNLSLTWDQAVEVARSLWWDRPSLPRDIFGGELGPMHSAELLSASPLWAPVALGALLQLAAWRRRRPTTESLTLIGIGLLLLVASLLSMRFLAFFLPVCALAGASIWTELARGWRWLGLSSGRWAAVAAGALCLSSGLALGPVSRNAAAALRRTRGVHTVEDSRAAIAFLDRVARPEDIVYHAFWAPFSALYFHRPEGRYIEALDPIFLYRRDPKLFAGMLDVYRGTAADPYGVIAGDFAARWLYLPKWQQFNPMLQLLRREPRIRPVYSDRFATIFEVRSESPSGTRARPSRP